MNYIDIVILGALLLGVISGIWSGFIKQAATCAALVLGVLFGWAFAGALGATLAGAVSHPLAAKGLAFALIFVAVGLAVRGAGWLLHKELERWSLERFDRLLGGVLGFFKGLLIAIVFCAVLPFVGTRESRPQRAQELERSMGGWYLMRIGSLFMPAQDGESVHDWAKRSLAELAQKVGSRGPHGTPGPSGTPGLGTRRPGATGGLGKVRPATATASPLARVSPMAAVTPIVSPLPLLAATGTAAPSATAATPKPSPPPASPAISPKAETRLTAEKLLALGFREAFTGAGDVAYYKKQVPFKEVRQLVGFERTELHSVHVENEMDGVGQYYVEKNGLRCSFTYNNLGGRYPWLADELPVTVFIELNPRPLPSPTVRTVEKHAALRAARAAAASPPPPASTPPPPSPAP